MQTSNFDERILLSRKPSKFVTHKAFLHSPSEHKFRFDLLFNLSDTVFRALPNRNTVKKLKILPTENQSFKTFKSKRKKKQEMAKTFVGEDSCQNISCAVKMALIELVPNKPIYKTERKTFASLFV